MSQLNIPIAAALALLAAACVSEQAPPAGATTPQVHLVTAGDAQRGLAYAQDACGSCHGLAPAQLSPNPLAPSFEEIANTPGMTAIALRAWLVTPHENMPDLIVDAERVDDLAAYIRTLKRAE